MKKTPFTFVLFLLWPVLSMTPQNVLTKQLHEERPGDCLVGERICYSDPGPEGMDVVWDFSRTDEDECQKHSVLFEEDSIFYNKKEDRTLFQYYSNNDSVVMVSYENPLTYVRYDKPLLHMVFPLSFNDEEHHSSFHGQGYYCNHFKVEEQGNMDLYVDGEGTLILPDRDTLDNVLRVKKVKTSSVRVDYEELSKENRKLMIEETYLWYARGFRYPVYETRSCSFLYNLEPVECYQTACCYVPRVQRKNKDEENEQIASTDSLMNATQGGILYNVSVENKHALLSIELSQNTRIQVVVADIYGYMYVQQSFNLDGGQHCLDIDCSMLQENSYALYINAYGVVYSEKIYIE